MIKLCAVVGPTAVGKTSCSISLAKDVGGEIISCDSMQIYKGMDIGTAKPTHDEMCGIRHHLIDICECTEEFSCADFCTAASLSVKEICYAGKLPIFCGGTGLYLDTFVSGMRQSPSGADEGVRAELEKMSNEELYSELQAVDPESAASIHINNRKRVIRALEIYIVTGETKTVWDRRSREVRSEFDTFYIGLDCKDRSLLYKRIDERVDIMIENGLINEVKSLKRPLSKTAGQAIGYKEIIDYFDGNISLECAINKIKQASRNYAKRQLTWFKRNPRINWYYTDDGVPYEKILSDARGFLTD